jgi:hypothetical protein
VSHFNETLEVLEHTQKLVHTVRSYGADHPAGRNQANELIRAVCAAGPPFSIQFVVQAVFRDFQVLPLDVERYDRVIALGAALHRLGAHEVTFSAAPSADDLLALAEAIATPTREPRPIDELGLSTVRFREIPDAVPGTEVETVEPEIFVAAQIVLGLRTIREALDGQSAESPRPWSFSVGMEAVRRLERALETHASLTASTLEAAPGERDVARRAMSAAHHVASVCTALSAPLAERRALTHAALAITALGLAPRGGRSFDEAVSVAHASCLSALRAANPDPHRLLVMSVLHDALYTKQLSALGLVRLAYELELQRCAPDVTFDLTLSDLLSRVVSSEDQDGVWIRMRIAVSRTIPPGARVRLKDGRSAVVLGPGPSGDPRFPLLLVDGSAEVAESEATLADPRSVSEQVIPMSPPDVTGPAARNESLQVSGAPAIEAAKEAEPHPVRARRRATEPLGAGARKRDPRRESTGPRIAPVPASALQLLKSEPPTEKEAEKPRPRRRDARRET